ncbi:oxidoreductase NAD-binding domain-containing protein 1-like isoform X2 [Haliotis rubra]|nr:oxidoreductase NAD-binding domain-containing protein 1-like isoform X2 [Haliotis rubra]XP_046543672.1 oxidoreductase NAD-binding domain-containing protein 1-like isoform X2 [Haliotis rubra]
MQIIQRHIVKMSSDAQTSDHLQRTADSSRQKIMSSATVLNIQDESRTVKSLYLKIHSEDFSFKAGQWVDTFIPGLDTMTGFSMCSSPGLLQREGMMHLAVKRSPHPPAEWVHTKCKVGSQVNLRVGGDYVYDPQPGEDPPTDLLLVAGGVGINPLMSMLSHIHDMHQSETSRSMCPNKVIIMFSAKTKDELLFRKRIDELCNLKPNNMSSMYFITEEKGATEDNTVYDTPEVAMTRWCSFYWPSQVHLLTSPCSLSVKIIWNLNMTITYIQSNQTGACAGSDGHVEAGEGGVLLVRTIPHDSRHRNNA